MSRLKTLLLLASILVVAFGLRLYKLGDYSVFFDEQASLLVSQGVPMEGANQPELHGKYFTPKDFWKPKTMADYYEALNRSDIGNSPAYYFLFHFWGNWFGFSDFSARFFSVIFSVLTVWLGFRFTRKHLKNDGIALAVALELALEPFFIAYSHQARNYSMTFFFTLLATDLFLDIVTSKKKVPGTMFLLYGLTALVVWYCHFLAIIVIAVHGLYVLLFVRDLRVWIGLGLAVLLPVAGMVWWMSPGKGGEYTLHTLGYQAKLYKTVAYTQPSEMVNPATIPNVWKKLAPILSDQFWVSNGLANRLVGMRNWAVCVAVTLLGAFCIWRYRKTEALVWPAIAVAALAGSLFAYTVNPFGYFVFQACLLLLSVFAGYFVSHRTKRPLLIFFLLLTFAPTALLVLMSFRNDHTFGLTQRYGGFSFPYAIILITLTLRESRLLPLWEKGLLVAAGVVQLVWLGTVLQSIYEDRSPKYTYRSEARISNPWKGSAEKLVKLYAPGDTIIYPNSNTSVGYGTADEYTRDIPVKILDAQLVNLYLPRQATYWQRVDPAERDKLYLWQKSTGKRILIFDFEGTKYRY